MHRRSRRPRPGTGRARTRSAALAGALALACAALPSMEPGEGTPAEHDVLARAVDDLHASLDEAERAVRASAAFGSDIERARGYEFLLRSLVQSVEAELLQDADYPYFRILDFWLRGGGDNPDQRYAFASIRGGEAYRIWGTVGSARRVEVQLYAGQPWAGTGRSVGYLTFEEIEVAPDGSFVIELVPEAQATAATPRKSRLANPGDTTSVFVRHIFDHWDARPTGDAHIDRVGFEGRRKPAPTPEGTAARIRATAANFALRAKTWPAFVEQRYVEARTANGLSPLVDTYALGGARGRWMANGYYDLPDGKVLVVKTWPTTAAYQAVQLTDLWFDSLEYGNQVSSLNTTQTLRAPDGAYYLVVAPDDPGYANWLDTGGLRRGTLLLRYDGVHGDVPPSQHPSAALVDIADLPAHIPGFAADGANEAEREAVRRLRRRHLQLRSHR